MVGRFFGWETYLHGREIVGSPNSLGEFGEIFVLFPDYPFVLVAGKSGAASTHYIVIGGFRAFVPFLIIGVTFQNDIVEIVFCNGIRSEGLKFLYVVGGLEDGFGFLEGSGPKGSPRSCRGKE
jgi:hypothetical protein